MKKILISLAVLAVAAGSAMAQISVGAGYLNETSITKISDNSSKASSDGFYAGASYSLALGKGFSIDPGVYYNCQFSNDFGAELGSLASADAKTTTHYLAVPVQVKFSYPVLPALDVFAFAGPQFKVGLASNTTATTTVLGNTTETTVDNYGENSSLNRFDVGMSVGLGVDVCDMVRVKFGYNWGLLDLNSNDNVTMHNNEWRIGVAFLF